MDSASPTELLRIARQDNQLSTAYKEIRQEVCYHYYYNWVWLIFLLEFVT